MPSPSRGAAPSFITTVQVIPAVTNTPGGTRVMRTVTGMRCARRTQVNVGLPGREELWTVRVILVRDASCYA